MTAQWRRDPHVDWGGRKVKAASAIMRPPRRIDHVSRQCEEPPLQTIREGCAMVEVLGLGNSLVDLLAYADDNYLSAQEMLKGGINLIDEGRPEALYAPPRAPSRGRARGAAS